MFTIEEDRFTKDLQLYMVGGAIRDKLLGFKIKDRDWVVVGSNPDEMLKRGFRRVGRKFPVFLHPITQEEFALARTEKKSGIGYRGFDFCFDNNVTLLDDLFRRDLTINSIALSRQGKIIDPFNGFRDIRMGILRNVSVHFKDDPLRLIRLARFSAKLPNFNISDDTLKLCRNISESGEIASLSRERIWKEISSGLMTDNAIKMFDCLQKTNVLGIIMPELVLSARVQRYLDIIPESIGLNVRYAILCLDSEKRNSISNSLNVQNSCRDYANLFPYIITIVDSKTSLEEKFILLEKCDAFRRPIRVRDLLYAARILGICNVDEVIFRLDRAINIDNQDIIKKSGNKNIGELLRASRLSAFKY